MEQLASVDKALDVLYHLHAEAAPCGVTEIGRALRVPKSTTHRLLTALGRRGLVERDAQGRYRPGMALIALGLGALRREPVVAAARPLIEGLAAEAGETLFLAAARGGRLLVLDKEEGSGFLRASPRIGSELPVHATAVGKLYLAFAPDQVALPEGGLESFTARTRPSRAALRRDVARAHERGWAENREEWIPELTGVAAPIRPAGRMVAALAIAGPSSRFGGADRDLLVRSVLAAAERTAASLEGRVS
jgi:IclR family acetate operon transcriptional repressor